MDKLGEGLPAYTAKADAFFQETPAKDLSELWTVKEIWESRVAALEQLLREAEHMGDGPANASRRLGWKLRQWGQNRIDVVPVEQKRTKTGAWTKGREVAIYRLVEQDRQETGLPDRSGQGRSGRHHDETRLLRHDVPTGPRHHPAGPVGTSQCLLGESSTDPGRDRAGHARGTHRTQGQSALHPHGPVSRAGPRRRCDRQLHRQGIADPRAGRGVRAQAHENGRDPQSRRRVRPQGPLGRGSQPASGARPGTWPSSRTWP